MSAAGPPYDTADKIKRELKRLWQEYLLLKPDGGPAIHYSILHHMFQILDATAHGVLTTAITYVEIRDEVLEFRELVAGSRQYFRKVHGGIAKASMTPGPPTVWEGPRSNFDRDSRREYFVRARDDTWKAYTDDVNLHTRVTKLSDFVTAATVAEDFDHPLKTEAVGKSVVFYEYMPRSGRYFRRADNGMIEEWLVKKVHSIGHRVARIHGTAAGAWEAQARRRYR